MASRESVQYLQACLSFKRKMIKFNNLSDLGSLFLLLDLSLFFFTPNYNEEGKKLFLFTTDRKIGSFSRKIGVLIHKNSLHRLARKSFCHAF